MSSILRGLLQSPASTTLAGDGPTVSEETPRLHRQHCIDQWDCIKKKDYQKENSICNIKMEENINQEQFWQHCSEETSDETTGSIEGFYYTYIPGDTGGWRDQDTMDEHGEFYMHQPHTFVPDNKTCIMLTECKQNWDNQPLIFNVVSKTRSPVQMRRVTGTTCKLYF